MIGIQETKNYLTSVFQMKDLNEVDTILGIKVIRHDTGYILNQTHYIKKLLEKFRHLGIKETNSPFDSSVKLPDQCDRIIGQLEYASAIGSLMYAMHCTRPDIAYSVGKLSRYTCRPGKEHWKAITRVLGYLKSTMNYGLVYSKHPSTLEGYCDASWITSMNDNKSTTGWIFSLGGGAISWASKKQTIIAHSTMEAEFIAFGGGKEARMAKKFIA
ncbi:secreted RxLR effector protein 161-like [Silene latifolia]|uniref:secreted RxLR effector protein 161-like n=1 Tax=Silene latifolia TaxID=37657 RepID=UPI003D782702